MLIISLVMAMLCHLGFTSDPPKNYTLHKVKVNAGEGVIKLLRRYHLDDHTCNQDAFYQLNKLNNKSHLIEGKQYYLPVYIYQYNGKSIRSTLGIDDWTQAVRIKTYNEKIKSDKLRQTNYLDSKILWVPHHEIKCEQKTTLPEKAAKSKVEKSESKNTLVEPLFGSKYESVEILDQKLKGHVYYIVSGHGGVDPGAECFNCSKKICEDEYAYDVALRLSRDLMQHGATVEIIVQDEDDGIRDGKMFACDRDERSYSGKKITGSHLKRLNQRSAEINKLYRKHKKKGVKSQQAVFLHVDSYAKSSIRRDTYFYYHSASKDGKQLATQIQKTFRQKYDKYQKNRGYKGHVSSRDGLFVLRRTQPTGVFIELANIQNPDDRKRILINSNRQALANWIFEGLTDKLM